MDVINNLNNSTSSGHDHISNFLLKKTVPDIITPLVHIINHSYSNGNFPKGLKISKVIPLFKSGDKHKVNKYRPISIISSLSKIIERIDFTRLSQYFQCIIFQILDSMVSAQNYLPNLQSPTW